MKDTYTDARMRMDIPTMVFSSWMKSVKMVGSDNRTLRYPGLWIGFRFIWNKRRQKWYYSWWGIGSWSVIKGFYYVKLYSSIWQIWRSSPKVEKRENLALCRFAGCSRGSFPKCSNKHFRIWSLLVDLLVYSQSQNLWIIARFRSVLPWLLITTDSIASVVFVFLSFVIGCVLAN